MRKTIKKVKTWLSKIISNGLSKLPHKVRILNPIYRGYYFYGKGGGPNLLIFAILLAIFVPLIIWGISACCLHIHPTNLLNKDQSCIFSETVSQEPSLFWAILSQYADPGNLPSAEGSWLAIICAVLGIFCLSGFLVSSLVNFIDLQAEKWRTGLRLYNYGCRKWWVKKIIVIIGINEQAPSIIRRAFERGAHYVFIQTRKDVEKARHDIGLKLDDKVEDKIVFYAGERTSADDIRKLCLEETMDIYVLGENINDPNEKDHDAFNMNCLEHISAYFKEYKLEHKDWKKRVRVHVHFEYQSTFTAFKATHLYQKLDRDIEFIPFNIHEIWAKKIFVDNFAVIPAGKNGELRVQRYNPIDAYRVENDKRVVGISEGCDRSVHLIIIGMNQLGTALATQAALLCHFPNFINNRKKRTTITFIDDNAKEEGDYFMGRFSTLFELCRHRTVVCDGSNLKHYCENEDKERNKDEKYVPFTDNMANNNKYNHLLADGEKESFLDIEWEFIQGNVASDEIKKYIVDISSDCKKTTTIAICFTQSHKSIASAMYLPTEVYKKANQVLVYQQNCFDIVDDIANGDAEWKRYHNNLFPFGMVENSYTENLFDNNLAKLFHYYYCQYPDAIKEDECLLKKVDDMWDQLGIVQKFANMDLADSIQMKYHSINIADPHNYASIPNSVIASMSYSEHLRWVVERLMIGFRCLTEEEQSHFVKQIDADYKKLILRKRWIIDKQRAHLDICSSRRLKDIDPVIYKRKYEDNLISNLPKLLKLAEWVSVLKLSDTRYIDSRHVKLLRSFFTYDRHNFCYHYIGKDQNGTNNSFWMAETPVTQAQWKKVMGVKRPVDLERTKKSVHDDMPVVNVSKQDVDDFLDILRKKTGLYFALPSFEEWKCAAKSSALPKKWVSSVKSPKKSPIKVFNSNKYQCPKTGLRHILGNVWEWTRSEDNHNRFEFCGGSWRFTELETKLESEYWHKSWEKEMRSDDLGFRLIWKFDVEKFGETELCKMMTPPKKQNKQQRDNELIRNWFKNRMVIVKAGKFVMGANEKTDKSADKNEMPRHIVKIPNEFYICNILVTQQLWNMIYPGEINPTTNRLGDDLPQTDISWDDVKKFIDELNVMKNARKFDGVLPDGTNDLVFRLPTEAEWEYAAKGGHKFSMNFEKAELVNLKSVNHEGNEREYKIKDVTYTLYSGSDNSQDVAWFDDNVIRQVAQKQSNDLGLFDMSGNVWEWCEDLYVWNMYEKGNVVFPIAKDESYSAHVFRGGGWRSTKWDCRCTRADFGAATYKSNDLGFRLVLGVPINDIKCNEPLNESEL